MAKKNQDEQPEVKDYILTGPLVVKGVAYQVGDRVPLTEEEAATLGELGAPLEGVEKKSEEEVQAAHEEGVEAQKKRIEEGPPKTEEEEEEEDSETESA